MQSQLSGLCIPTTDQLAPFLIMITILCSGYDSPTLQSSQDRSLQKRWVSEENGHWAIRICENARAALCPTEAWGDESYFKSNFPTPKTPVQLVKGQALPEIASNAFTFLECPRTRWAFMYTVDYISQIYQRHIVRNVFHLPQSRLEQPEHLSNLLEHTIHASPVLASRQLRRIGLVKEEASPSSSSLILTFIWVSCLSLGKFTPCWWPSKHRNKL